MSKAASHKVRLGLVLFLVVPAASAQKKNVAQPDNRASENAQAAKVPDKVSLRSLTLPSTSEAARKAAEDASARAKTAKATAQISDPSKGTQESSGAVLEFRPADGFPPEGAGSGTSRVKDRKKSLLKNLHGSAYGISSSAPGGANDEGGAVGADSARGKMNIYIEGEHVHPNTPGPH